MATLKIKNLKKGFEGLSIIKGIDLEVRDKEFVVFVGPSGCGKSTLLRLIAGLEDVTSGTIELDGRDITEVTPAKRDLAIGFLGTPKMGFLQARVQAVNVSGVEVRFTSGATLLIPRDNCALSIGQSITVGVRPEHLTLGTEGHVQVTTDVTERLGSDTFCHVNVDSGESLTVRVHGDCEVPYGAKRYLNLDVAHCHLFDDSGLAVSSAASRAA